MGKTPLNNNTQKGVILNECRTLEREGKKVKN